MSFFDEQDILHGSLETLANEIPAFSALLNAAKHGNLREIKKVGPFVLEYVQRQGAARSTDTFYVPDSTIIHNDLLSIAYASSLSKLNSCDAKPHYSRFVDGLIEGDFEKVRTGYGILHHILEWDVFEAEKTGRDRLLELTKTYALKQARLSGRGGVTAFCRENYCRMATNAAEYCGSTSPADEILAIYTYTPKKKRQ